MQYVNVLREAGERARSSPPAPVEVRLFGPLQVCGGETTLGRHDLPGHKPAQLLAALVWQRGHVVSKERLAWLLWRDNPPRNHVATLETYVSVLRRALADGGVPSLVHTEHRGYRIDSEAVVVDLDVFDALLELAAGAGPASAVLLLRRALSMVRGHVLEGEPDAEWAHDLRDRYARQHVQALVDAGRASLVTGDVAAALAFGQEAVRRSPLAEPAYQVVMLAAYALWRQDEALAAFDRCRRMLADELGADPLEATLTLHLGILRHVPVADLLVPLLVPPARAAHGLGPHAAAPDGQGGRAGL